VWFAQHQISKVYIGYEMKDILCDYPGEIRLTETQGFEKVTPGNDLRGENPKWAVGPYRKNESVIIIPFIILYIVIY